MHMGTMKFKQRGREEQAEADGTDVSILNICNLTQIFSKKFKIIKKFTDKS